jgi:hypothetical protein
VVYFIIKGLKRRIQRLVGNKNYPSRRGEGEVDWDRVKVGVLKKSEQISDTFSIYQLWARCGEEGTNNCCAVRESRRGFPWNQTGCEVTIKAGWWEHRS